jgi:hypothetical protein
MIEVLTARVDWPQRAMLEEIRALGSDLVRHLRETEEDL